MSRACEHKYFDQNIDDVTCMIDYTRMYVYIDTQGDRRHHPCGCTMHALEARSCNNGHGGEEEAACDARGRVSSSEDASLWVPNPLDPMSQKLDVDKALSVRNRHAISYRLPLLLLPF